MPWRSARLLPAAMPDRLLRFDGEVGAAVLRPALLGVLGAERPLLAVADARDALALHAVRDEVVHRRARAAVTERDVVLVGAPLVGVALDQQEVLRVGLHPLRARLEHLGGVGADVVAVDGA